MNLRTARSFVCSLVSAGAIATGALTTSAQQKPEDALVPSTMPKMGAVDARFVSYNIEMVEVTGGRFWKPYKSAGQPESAPAPNAANPNQQVGIDPGLFQYRPPIDLGNPRLR